VSGHRAQVLAPLLDLSVDALSEFDLDSLQRDAQACGIGQRQDQAAAFTNVSSA
jgi:hypothetical protein